MEYIGYIIWILLSGALVFCIMPALHKKDNSSYIKSTSANETKEMKGFWLNALAMGIIGIIIIILLLISVKTLDEKYLGIIHIVLLLIFNVMLFGYYTYRYISYKKKQENKTKLSAKGIRRLIVIGIVILILSSIVILSAIALPAYISINLKIIDGGLLSIMLIYIGICVYSLVLTYFAKDIIKVAIIFTKPIESMLEKRERTQ